MNNLNGEYSTYFFGNNAQYEYAINDHMDFTVQISSRQESELENELNITFPEREQRTVCKIIKTMINKSRHKKSDKKLIEYEDKRIKRLREKLSNSSWESLDKMKSLEYKK